MAIANVTADSLTTTFLQFGDRLELLDFLTGFLRGLQGFLSEFQVDEIDVEEERRCWWAVSQGLTASSD